MTLERNSKGRFVKGGTKNPKAYAWNKNNYPSRKGLTKENDESVKRQADKVGKTLRNQYKNGRVSNRLGKENKWGHHTEKVKEKLRKRFTTTGITLYRKKAYEKYGYKCNRCGVVDKRVLLVHHRDRNRRNNKVENLEVMCYNCHAIEHEFGHRKK